MVFFAVTAAGVMARTGAGNAGRAGEAGVTCGAGGSMNCASTSAGTISSAARSAKPLCSAQTSTTCSITTLAAMAVLRLRRGKGMTGMTGIRRGRFDGEMACLKSGSPRKGSVWRVCAGRDNQKRDIAEAAGVCPLKIHQAQPITKPKLTGRVMIKIPGWTMMQVAPDGCLTKHLLSSCWHCTAPPRRRRNLYSSHTEWYRQALTERRQRPCQRGHGGQFRGQRFGGRHK